MKTEVLIAQNLFAFRVANKKTQTWVSNQIGVTFQQVQKYEKTINNISLVRLLKFCEVFQINIADFLYSNADEIIKSSKLDELTKQKCILQLQQIEVNHKYLTERKQYDKGRSNKDMVGQSLDPRTYL